MIEGGCLCGSLRYSSSADPTESGYCHCRMCQKLSGAPVVAWTGFPAGSFSYTKGEPATYRSSPNAQREYCASCGSQILFRDSTEPDSVWVNSCTADRPEALVPEYHIFCDSRVSWFETNDELPRYGDGGPD